MFKFDFTISITVILALAAVVSPIATAIINNHYQLKLKKMELKQQEYENTILRERKMYEDFLKSAGAYIYNSNASSAMAFGESYLSLLMYAPEEIRNLMLKAERFVALNEKDEAVKILEVLAPKIRTILQTK